MKKRFVCASLCALFSASALFLASCILEDDFSDGEPYVRFDEQAYLAAKATWESRALESYTFTYQEQSDATGPSAPKVTVTVLQGSSSYTVENQAQSEVYSSLSCQFPTADALFSQIDALYTSACETVSEKPAGLVFKELSVSYDEATGIPTAIRSCGWWAENVCCDGDWWELYITDIAVTE